MEISDGEVRPADGQVHGRLPALPRRRGAQGGQRLHRQAQGNEVHPIRGLVSGLKLKTKLQMIMTNYHIYFEREQSTNTWLRNEQEGKLEQWQLQLPLH